MKHLPAIFVFIVMLALASCSEWSSSKPMASKQDDAALQLYYKYAEDTSLTVAYMGDFFLNGNKIDALMLRADSDDDWNQLKNDFGIPSKLDGLCDDSDYLSAFSDDDGNKKIVSVGIGFETDFIEDLGLDTITDLSQVDDERFNKMKAMIAESIRGIMMDFPVDSIMPSEAIIVGDGHVAFDDEKNLNMDEYLNILSEAIGKTLLNDVLVQNGVLPDGQCVVPEGLVLSDSTMRNARDFGHQGYVSAADDKSRTLWLFFYDDQEECNNILTHIKEDILVGGQNK